jgi:hypothetical protein
MVTHVAFVLGIEALEVRGWFRKPQHADFHCSIHAPKHLSDWRDA